VRGFRSLARSLCRPSPRKDRTHRAIETTAVLPVSRKSVLSPRSGTSPPRAGSPTLACWVYARSTWLPSPGFGRHRGLAHSFDSCGFARLGTTEDDRRSTLVMKGSAVRIRASASYRNRQVPAQRTFPLPARMTPPVTGGRIWTQRRVQRGFIGLTAARTPSHPSSRPRSAPRRSMTCLLLTLRRSVSDV
jgi:hypothetical protein